MITDIKRTKTIHTLNTKLPNYWDGFFIYERDLVLSELTKNELVNEIDKIKRSSNHYIDSQIIVGDVLTRLARTNIFHRQFNERFPLFHKEQILGMQLYKIMIEDSDTWTYHSLIRKEHRFSHATYFK